MPGTKTIMDKFFHRTKRLNEVCSEMNLIKLHNTKYFYPRLLRVMWRHNRRFQNKIDPKTEDKLRVILRVNDHFPSYQENQAKKGFIYLGQLFALV